MISTFAGLLLQAAGQMPAPPAPPPPPPPPSMRMAAPPAPPPPPPPPLRKPRHRARANLAEFISHEDYPVQALRNGEQGAVGFRLQVGVEGSVTGCTVTQSSGSASLDSATCRLLTARARFTPARNKRGQPVTDHVSARMVWRIEDEPGLRPVAATLIVATLRATEAGEVTCSGAVNAQPPQAHSCPTDVATRMGALARRAGMPLEHTIVTIVTPEGDVEPADPGDHGILTFEGEVVVGIAADGSIRECRVARSEVRDAPPHFTPPNPCDAFKPGPRPVFQPATEAGAARSANIKMRAYARP